MNRSIAGTLALALVLAGCSSPSKAGDHEGRSAAASNTANTDATQTAMQDHMKQMHAQDDAGDIMKHHEMMEKRVDMMQQMLEHPLQKDKAAAEAQRK